MCPVRAVTAVGESAAAFYAAAEAGMLMDLRQGSRPPTGLRPIRVTVNRESGGARGGAGLHYRLL